jgi:hypothetical protein
MSESNSSVRPALNKQFPYLFDGYPYLVTKIVPALYHIIVLPSELSVDKLLVIAGRQVSFNSLETCLALKEDKCIYFWEDGSVRVSGTPPVGNNFIYDRLLPCWEFPETEEFRQRKESLKLFCDSLKRLGYLHGDLSKGARPAKEDEMSRLPGKQPNGVPNGLVQCNVCGCWAGECLDQNPASPGMVVEVHCRCQNDNLCARCGEPLYNHKLNANYCREDGSIWHVPGFSGLSHRCG